MREGGGWLWGNVAEAPGRPFSPSGHALARVLWLHYLSKVHHSLGMPQDLLAVVQQLAGWSAFTGLHAQAYEFTDTLIMILKKKERQISFL